MATKSEHRTGKSRKDTVKKMGRRSDAKNEKDWHAKVGRTDPKKMGRSDSKNENDCFWMVERTDRKNEKVWLKKWEGLTRKMGSSDSKHGRSESKQGSPIQKHCRSDSKKEGLVDTSQSSYLRHFWKEYKMFTQTCFTSFKEQKIYRSSSSEVFLNI